MKITMNRDRPSLRKKLYQTIICRLDGKNIADQRYKKRLFRLVENGIGGFILFGGVKDEVKQAIRELQEASEFPLFIASDIERGAGQQVSDCTIFPCQMAIAAAIGRDDVHDRRLLERALSAIAAEAAYIGINMPLIPVLDVNQDPGNPIICTRAFSDDPEIVSWFGSQYIRILEQAGLLSCAKHFPGHGDTTIDSHLSLPVIHKSYEALKSVDIKPFRDAVIQGISCIMVGHLSVPTIDSLPATLSRAVYRLLRSDLQFEGLILTDALIMSALNDIPDAEARCLEAGADILLHPADPDETVERLMSAFLSGDLSEERVEEAFSRITGWKMRLKNFPQRDIDWHAHAGFSRQLSEKSISLIKGVPNIVPLADGEKIYVFIAGDQEPSSLRSLKTLSPHVKKSGDHADFRDSTAVIAVFSSIAAWEGSADIADGQKEDIRAIVNRSRKSIVIAFGNPYILRHFPESHALIAAYEDSDTAQRMVVEWLRGAAGLRGRMPVRLS